MGNEPRRWLRRNDNTYWVASTDDMYDTMVKGGFTPCTEAEAMAAEGPAQPAQPATPDADAATGTSGGKAGK